MFRGGVRSLQGLGKTFQPFSPFHVLDELVHQFANQVWYIHVFDAHALTRVLGVGGPCHSSLDISQLDRDVSEREFQPDSRPLGEWRVGLDKAAPPAHVAGDSREDRVNVSTVHMDLEAISRMSPFLLKVLE